MLECSTLPGAAFWPLDPAGNAYGYLVGAAGDDATDKEVEQVEWAGALEGWQSPLGSVTELLDPEPSVELRASVCGFVRELEKRSPGISSHVVVLAEPLGPITKGADLVAAVQRLYRLAVERRNREGLRGAVRWEQDWEFRSPTPDCVVLPVSGDPTRFFVAGDGQRSVFSDDVELEVRQLPHDEVGQRLADLDSAWTWVLVPENAAPEERAALSNLFHELNSPPAPTGPLVTMWPWRFADERLQDADSVRALLSARRENGIAYPPYPP